MSLSKPSPFGRQVPPAGHKFRIQHHPRVSPLGFGLQIRPQHPPSQMSSQQQHAMQNQHPQQQPPMHQELHPSMPSHQQPPQQQQNSMMSGGNPQNGTNYGMGMQPRDQMGQFSSVKEEPRQIQGVPYNHMQQHLSSQQQPQMGMPPRGQPDMKPQILSQGPGQMGGPSQGMSAMTGSGYGGPPQNQQPPMGGLQAMNPPMQQQMKNTQQLQHPQTQQPSQHMTSHSSMPQNMQPQKPPGMSQPGPMGGPLSHMPVTSHGMQPPQQTSSGYPHHPQQSHGGMSGGPPQSHMPMQSSMSSMQPAGSQMPFHMSSMGNVPHENQSYMSGQDTKPMGQPPMGSGLSMQSSQGMMTKSVLGAPPQLMAPSHVGPSAQSYSHCKPGYQAGESPQGCEQKAYGEASQRLKTKPMSSSGLYVHIPQEMVEQKQREIDQEANLMKSLTRVPEVERPAFFLNVYLADGPVSEAYTNLNTWSEYEGFKTFPQPKEDESLRHYDCGPPEPLYTRGEPKYDHRPSHRGGRGPPQGRGKTFNFMGYGYFGHQHQQQRPGSSNTGVVTTEVARIIAGCTRTGMT